MIIDGIEYLDSYKENETDEIYWLELLNEADRLIGQHLFSFDLKKVYNFFSDYEKLTPEQKAIFDKERPDLAELKNI